MARKNHRRKGSNCPRWRPVVLLSLTFSLPLFVSPSLGNQKNTAMLIDCGSAPLTHVRCDSDVQRQCRQWLALLAHPGGCPRLRGQRHPDRHQFPQHHGGRQRKVRPPASPPQRLLPSPAVPAPPPPAGASRDQPVVRCASDLSSPRNSTDPDPSSVLYSRSCVLDYDDPDDYLDVSNHEVDRQDPLEYEVRRWRTAVGGSEKKK